MFDQNDHDSSDLSHSPIPPSGTSVKTTQKLQFGTDNTNATSTKTGSQLIDLILVVDAFPGCGGIAWPAGEVLANYLVHRGHNFLHGKSIIELGSGTGLVGLVAGKLGATDVCITDQAPLLPLMKENVALNGLADFVSVVELNWGEPLPNDVPSSPDLILAADCVYLESAFPLLVQTLSDLVLSPNTDVLFCYKKRRKADKRFFSLLKKQFTWTDITDHPDREIYSRDAISLLRLTKIWK